MQPWGLEESPSAVPRAFAGGSVNLASQGAWRFLSLAAGGALVDRVEIVTLINTGTQFRYGMVDGLLFGDDLFTLPTDCFINVERGPVASRVTQGNFSGVNPFTPAASFPLVNTGGSGGNLGNLNYSLALWRPIFVPFNVALVIFTTSTVVGSCGVVFGWSEFVLGPRPPA